MFGATTAKRVGRNELESPASSPRSSPDPAFTELLRTRVHNEFAFTTADSTTPIDDEDVPAEEVDDDEAELVLFAGPTTNSRTRKIRLSSPDAALGEPSIAVKKPRSYYFADDVTSDHEEELAAAALTGEAVLALGKIAWPGCAVPWKVTKITPAGIKNEVLISHSPIALATVEEKDAKRRRKGKKSRIALRKQMQAARARESAKAKLAAEKAEKEKEREEAEREKRTKRNREKKVKKKARDKAKKAGEGAEALGGESAENMDGVE